VFSQDSALGFLTTSPKNIGTAIDLHARVLTHTNLSDKTHELMMKNYKCKLTKIEKRLYSIDLARTLCPNLSENDSINMFLDCIERALNTHEPQEDEVDKAPENLEIKVEEKKSKKDKPKDYVKKDKPVEEIK